MILKSYRTQLNEFQRKKERVFGYQLQDICLNTLFIVISFHGPQIHVYVLLIRACKEGNRFRNSPCQIGSSDAICRLS